MFVKVRPPYVTNPEAGRRKGFEPAKTQNSPKNITLCLYSNGDTLMFEPTKTTNRLLSISRMDRMCFLGNIVAVCNSRTAVAF